jgi:hypothetical protein
MSDVLREKYRQLMAGIVDLEDQIEKLESESSSDQSKLALLKNELAVKKNELSRVSDGCGKPHGHNL